MLVEGVATVEHRGSREVSAPGVWVSEVAPGVVTQPLFHNTIAVGNCGPRTEVVLQDVLYCASVVSDVFFHTDALVVVAVSVIKAVVGLPRDHAAQGIVRHGTMEVLPRRSPQGDACQAVHVVCEGFFQVLHDDFS